MIYAIFDFFAEFIIWFIMALVFILGAIVMLIVDIICGIFGFFDD